MADDCHSAGHRVYRSEFPLSLLAGYGVVCLDCNTLGETRNSDLPVWTSALYWEHVDQIEGPERAARLRALVGQ